MRVAVALVAMGMLGLTGCKKEPSFDERYDAAQEKAEKMARDIDGDLTDARDQSSRAPSESIKRDEKDQTSRN